MESTKDTNNMDNNNKNTSPFKFVLTNEGKIFLDEVVGESNLKVVLPLFVHTMIEV